MDERQWKTKRERQAAKAENEQAAKEMAGDFDPMARIRDLEAEVERLKERHRQAIHEQALSWQASLTAWANRAEAAEAKLAAVNDALESSDDYENFECWHGATLGSCGNERCLACNVYLAVKAPMPADPEAP